MSRVINRKLSSELFTYVHLRDWYQPCSLTILLLFYTKTILKRRDPGLPENWESNPAMIGAVHGLIRGELTYARAELKKTVRDSYCILILYY